MFIGSCIIVFPSSGARDCDVDYHIGRFVLGLLCVGGYVLLAGVVSGLQAKARVVL